ncbi:Uu.00g109300.m01.CDS01 [Anthostomella pinea]|uniref:Uu.00g109300.m01.CDS01 n=1 Tax=Anthostomella pinea TaxID=933095 RepID=A0AAI8YDR3_9PEZI|nr:Uu.00g109300.m01.CDS01 [Anthostomella pinea]
MSAFVNWTSLTSWMYTGAVGPQPVPMFEPVPVPETQLDDTYDAPRVWTQNALLTIAALVLSTLSIWYLLRRKKTIPATSRLNEQHEAVEAVRRECDQRIASVEARLGDALRARTAASEEHMRKALSEQVAAIEDGVRKGLNKRIETLEVRMRLDQEALDDVHKVLSQRMEAFEDYIRAVDARQLDQEASEVAQRGLGQRLEAAEESLRGMESKTRASSQRIEALDDSSRLIDSRTKTLSQRVEAVEDNLSTVDGQTTLLAHDIGRGVTTVEKLQRQVKLLPDAEKLNGLSRTCEAEHKKLETKISDLENTAKPAEPSCTLTWSNIETQEIEPSGPVYADPQRSFFDRMTRMPISPSPSPGDRPQYAPSGHSRSYSTASSSPPMYSPMTPEQKRLESAGFREMTFSSRQRQLLSRNSWAK